MMEYLALSIFIGFCSAQLTKLLDFSFNEGNVLDWYYMFLIERVEPISKKLAKPLGTCINCFSVWVCFLVFLIFAITNNIPWYFLFISEGISYFFIIKENKSL